jgi:transposase InsO family protein
VLQTQDAGARPCAPAADRGVLARPALGNALLAHGSPAIFRPDNGAEYNAKATRAFLVSLNIAISSSKKGRHWENGYRESFYDKFKIDLGDSGPLLFPRRVCR